MGDNITRVYASTYMAEPEIQIRLETKEGYTWYKLTLNQARALRKTLNAEIRTANIFQRARHAAYKELSAIFQKERARG